MPSKTTSRVLTDHEEIRKWVEERGATPARVMGTGNEEIGDPGILRIDFPGYTGEDTLEPVSWDEWFRKFDESRLALTVQDYTASGERSNFNKIVSRETAQAVLQKTGSSRGGGTTTDRKQSATASRSSAAGRAKTSGKSTGQRSTKTTKSKTASRGTKQTARRSGAKVITMKKRSASGQRSSSTAGKSKRAQGKSGGRRAA